MIQDQQLIHLLAEHEEVIANLYEKYSEILPNKDFWKSLVKDERMHHQWLETLSNQTVEKNIKIDQERFHLDALRTSVDYIQNLVANAQSHNQLNALSYSLDIEKALIEEKYFEVFISDSTEVKKILNNLLKMTKMHVQKVQEELEEAKVINEIANQH